MSIQLVDDIGSLTCPGWTADEEVNFVFHAEVEEIVVPD